MRSLTIIIFILLSSFAGAAHTATANGTPLEQAQILLQSKSFNDKSQAVSLLAESTHSQSTEILKALMEGELYYRKSDKQLLLAKKLDGEYLIHDALTGEDLGSVKKRLIKKIGTNNAIRKQIRAALASRELNNPDADIRYQAASEMLGSPDAGLIPQLEKRLAIEDNSKVRQQIELLLAISQLDTDNRDDRLLAIEAVTGSVEPVVRSKLASIEANDPDADVRKAAKTALNSISVRLQFFSFIEALFFGLYWCLQPSAWQLPSV